MMLHNGVDPTQTEGMSKGAHRSEGGVFYGWDPWGVMIPVVPHKAVAEVSK